MPVPLALAGPAVVAGLAYINARTSLSYDYQLFGSAFKGQRICATREKNDRLNFFYVLEEYALGKQANDVFLIFEGKQWTYKETYDTVLKYGTWFKTRHGIKSKDVVAVNFMNSEKFVFVWFGLWSIGAKPAFLNYNLVGKALEHCIKVSTAPLLIVDDQLQQNITQEIREALPGVQFDILSPGLEAEVLSTKGVREPDSCRTEKRSQDMGALIYTSGTTGLPKPAIVSWIKMNVASILIPGWLNYKRGDIFYTV